MQTVALPLTPTMLCLQHFEGYDPEGYVMYFCDYKYPEENTVNYIVMNKVGDSLALLLWSG